MFFLTIDPLFHSGSECAPDPVVARAGHVTESSPMSYKWKALEREQA